MLGVLNLQKLHCSMQKIDIPSKDILSMDLAGLPMEEGMS